MAETDITSTELDFDSIKTSLKNFFASQDEFSDYDFEGSGLSNILDVLAYNTHYNALIGNMGINESFLETAQLRSSVITHALSLGYFPRSRTASFATVSLSADLSTYPGDKPSTITLPSNTKFNATVNNTVYVFQTREALTGTDPDGSGVYYFSDADGSSNIKIYEGIQRTRTFYVPEVAEKRIYVITDENMDTSTVSVSVYKNKSSLNYVSYSNISDAIRIQDDSRYYLLKESPNGYYELQFGDGVLTGLSPSTNNKIEVEYLSVSGPDANGAKVFTPQSGITVGDTSYSLTATRIATSTNGAEKQSINSVKKNAPLYYASQRRLVTAADYYSQILVNYPTLEDCIAWGGEENVPVDYGKIFISIKYPEGTTDATKTQIETSITNDMITPLATMSITPVYVEPVTTYLGIRVNFDFNPDKTNLTLRATGTLIENTVAAYFQNNLGLFGSTFRRSDLLAEIDDADISILSSALTPTMIQRLTLNLASSTSYTMNFPEQISTPDDVNHRIWSSKFVYNGTTAQVKNKLNSTTLQIFDLTGVVLAQNVGTYTPDTGKVSLENFVPTSIQGNLGYLKIFATPAKESAIKPIKNYILALDADETVAVGTIDYQKTRVTV